MERQLVIGEVKMAKRGKCQTETIRMKEKCELAKGEYMIRSEVSYDTVPNPRMKSMTLIQDPNH
jgi:hypothetical protein